MQETEFFQLSATTASMIATWIWAASFYASATSGFKYGLSGPLHYGFWGALMILFIYPFGRRFRQLAPKAHTLAEVIHARHGTSSQMTSPACGWTSWSCSCSSAPCASTSY